MAKAKLTVTAPDGRVYTRRSDNLYTHAVVSRGTPLSQRLALRNRNVAYCQKQIVEYTETIRKQGHAGWAFNGVVRPEDANKYNVWIEQYHASIAKYEAQDHAAEYAADVVGEWEVTYHRRIDLAQKEALKRGQRQEQVHIVEVK